MLTKAKTVIKSNPYLFLILFVATLIRFIGTNPGYNQFHSDEGMSYAQAVAMIKEGTFDPKFGYALSFAYPSLIPLINLVAFKFLFIPAGWGIYFLKHILQIIDGVVHIPISPLEANRILQVEILGNREINSLFWGRYVTALFSLGNVFLTYLLTRKLFGKQTGLIAAALLALNFRQVLNSHIGLPDIYNSFFLLLAILMSVSVWNNPNKKNYLLAGIATGLSFSTKYQFYAFLPLLCVHVYTLLNKEFSWKKNLNLGLSFAGAGLTFVILNPYLIIHFEEAQDILSYVAKKYGIGTNKINLYPLWYLWNVDFGPLLMLLSFAGILFSLTRGFKKALLLLLPLFLFAYLFLYYSGGGFYTRNLITITPLLLIFAAVFLFWLFSSFKNYIGNLPAISFFTIFFVAAIFIPARNAFINSYFYTKPWNYDVLRVWESQNLPAGSVIAAHPFDPLEVKNVKRTEFNMSGSYSLSEHFDDGASYALINMDWGSNDFYYWMHCGANFWKCQKPLQQMRNTFPGLVAEEIAYYQIFSAAKPWQAPDAPLILAKFPIWSEMNMQSVKTIDFRQNPAIAFTDDGDIFKTEIDNSILKITLVSFQTGASRVYFSPIEVKPGFLYKVKTRIKSDTQLSKDTRDGYLRVDFYTDLSGLNEKGQLARISSRYWGQGWQEREIIERAPDETKYMVISFQVYGQKLQNIWLDNIEIFQSTGLVEDLRNKAPYTKKEIDLNLIYPNSQGNL